MASISNQFKPDLDLRMLTIKRTAQNGFLLQTFQAQISQNGGFFFKRFF